MFRIIAIMVLVYFLLKAIGKIFSPSVASTGKRYYRNTNAHQNQQQEGSIRVDKKPSHKGEKHVSGGEYVDFEEVD